MKLTPAQERRLYEAFGVHPISPAQYAAVAEVGDLARSLAEHYFSVCPSSRELNLAMRQLEESAHWAAAAIVRYPREPAGAAPAKRRDEESE